MCRLYLNINSSAAISVRKFFISSSIFNAPPLIDIQYKSQCSLALAPAATRATPLLQPPRQDRHAHRYALHTLLGRHRIICGGNLEARPSLRRLRSAQRQNAKCRCAKAHRRCLSRLFLQRANDRGPTHVTSLPAVIDNADRPSVRQSAKMSPTARPTPVSSMHKFGSGLALVAA